MAGKKRDKSKRAAELRKQISKLKSQDTSDDDGPEMKPGESPKEYVERRVREGGFKKATPDEPK